MFRLMIFLTILQIWITNTEAATNVLSKNFKRGSGSEGKYKPDVDKWAYKPDNRGKYVHVPVPYNGGYGPFMNPYDHLDNPYDHIEKKYVDDPFGNNFFSDPRPAIIRAYGAPTFNA